MKDLFKKIKPYLVYFIALLGGAIMPFAFSPYNFGFAAIFSPTILLWCLVKRSPWQACFLGWLYGIGMFGAGVNWVYVSIHDYGYASVPLAVVITSLFIVIIACYPAAMAYLLNRYFKRNNVVRNALAFPALWVCSEILRGWLFTGFPWLYVGYSQMGNQLRAFAPLGSVWAVSLATLVVAGIFYTLIDYYYVSNGNTKYRNKLFLAMFAIWALAFALHEFKWTITTDQKLEVALVQGNIGQLMRWDTQYVSSIVQTYEELTATNWDKANLIVWPEGAIPIALPLSQQFFRDLGVLAKERHVALIAGVPSQLPDQEHYYNSLIGVGEAQGTYYKNHLVPFGEYVPLEKYLRGIISFLNLPMSSFIEGPSKQELLTAFDFKVAPAICYEIAYPLYVQQMSKNADVILTVSNDAWFGTSNGPAQHLQIAQCRALETGKFVIRATNTGLTAIIEPDSEIQAIAPQFETTVLNGTVNRMHGQTPWVRYGMWPLLAVLVSMLGGAFYLRSKQKA